MVQREAFQRLIENVLDIITVLNGDGIIRYESSSIERVLGYETDELIGESFFEFIHPDDVLAVINVFNDGLQISGCIVSLEFRFQRKDGSWCALETIAKNLLDDPAVAGIVLNSRDITERVRAEKELRQRFEKLQRALEGTITALAAMVEKRDLYIVGHHQRVTQLACAIAEEMGLTEERIEGLRVAGTLHDIGRIGVPIQILSKPSQLAEIELAMVKTHPQVGYDLLRTIEFPWPVAPILLQHHERMDGSGYPKGLVGESILLEARILGVADVVEAMTCRRSYRSALGVDKALGEISRNSGVLYDPGVVEACLKLFTEKGFTFE
jgi:PAS domain S-box-containing protein